jgi:hypothetical protein
VSAESVQDVVLWIYKSSLRLQNQIDHLFSWQDARLTFKALLLTVAIFWGSWLFGDAWFLMLAFNVYMVIPFIEKKKPQLIEQVYAVINSKIDLIVTKVPFIKRIEN